MYLCEGVIEVDMNAEKTEKISFTVDDGSTVDFYVEEQTVIAGITYLLVSESPDEDSYVYVMQDISGAEDKEAVYEMVEDEDEPTSVFRVFEQVIGDDDILFEE